MVKESRILGSAHKKRVCAKSRSVRNRYRKLGLTEDEIDIQILRDRLKRLKEKGVVPLSNWKKDDIGKKRSHKSRVKHSGHGK